MSVLPSSGTYLGLKPSSAAVAARYVSVEPNLVYRPAVGTDGPRLRGPSGVSMLSKNILGKKIDRGAAPRAVNHLDPEKIENVGDPTIRKNRVVVAPDRPADISFDCLEGGQ